jgi:DNA-binding transcriptional LysR family regulator
MIPSFWLHAKTTPWHNEGQLIGRISRLTPIISVHRSSGNRTLLDAALGRANLKLDWVYEVTYLSTSLGLVEAGLGIAVLPRTATPMHEHPILVTRPILNPTVSRTIDIIRRHRSTLPPATDRFLQMLVNEWGTTPSGFGPQRK